jgi:hypothetical protein
MLLFTPALSMLRLLSQIVISLTFLKIFCLPIISTATTVHNIYLTSQKDTILKYYTILEDGFEVEEFYNTEQGINKTALHHGWVSLLIGILILMGKVSLNEKLQDIWPEDLACIWANVSNTVKTSP